MNSQEKNSKVYIFDLDGTLFDSMDLWEKVDAAFFSKRGIDMPPDYTKTVIAMDMRETAAYTIERFGLCEDADDMVREWIEAAAYAYGHTVHMKPHAREYLRALREAGVVMAIATSLTADLYEPALRANGIMDCFDAFISTTQTPYGKSKPDVYLMAAEALNTEPRDCIVFEDILTAIRSAKGAGMTVYAIYDSASGGDWEQMVIEADGAYRDFHDVPLPDGKKLL